MHTRSFAMPRAGRAGGGRAASGDGKKSRDAAVFAQARTFTPRNFLTIGEKKKVLRDLDSFGVKAVAEKWDISRKTVQRIKKRRDDIEQGVEDDCKHYVPGARTGKPTLERRVLEWVETVRRAKTKVKLGVSRLSINAAATKIRAQLLAPGSGISDSERRELEAWGTVGVQWAKGFVKRHKLVNVCLNGAGGEVDLDDPDLQAKIEVIKEKCAEYDVDRIYNVDEFGLFYKCLPRRTYLAKSESRKTARGTKAMKSRTVSPGTHAPTHQAPTWWQWA